MTQIHILKYAGQRIDKYLAKKYPTLSRNLLQAKIKTGKFLVNGKKVTPSYKLKRNDLINFNQSKLKKITRSLNQKPHLNPDKSVSFKIIFEHPDFIIIEKPAGLAVHPAETGPFSPAKKIVTLVHGLLSKYPSIKNIGEDILRPGIVHRLDKNTSGLMIIAKKQKAYRYFKKIFKKRELEKKYLALVWGKLKTIKGVIQTPIGKSKSDLTRQATSKFSNKLINPKKAITFYRVISSRKQFTFENTVFPVSLLELQIKTGRKHQIRVHLHSIGYSILGDRKYQTKLVKDPNKYFSRHLLHAYQLKFKYLDGEEYNFESKPPKDFYLT